MPNIFYVIAYFSFSKEGKVYINKEHFKLFTETFYCTFLPFLKNVRKNVFKIQNEMEIVSFVMSFTQCIAACL